MKLLLHAGVVASFLAFTPREMKDENVVRVFAKDVGGSAVKVLVVPQLITILEAIIGVAEVDHAVLVAAGKEPVFSPTSP
ncbi:MAG: hypothetical protein R3E58_00675 [Phycisphaerae bacterium]